MSWQGNRVDKGALWKSTRDLVRATLAGAIADADCGVSAAVGAFMSSCIAAGVALGDGCGMTESTVSVELRGHVLLIGLNREKKRNAFTTAMLREPHGA